MHGTCPECGSKRVVPIEYGLPGPRGFEAAAQSEVVLGGCCVVVDPGGEVALPNRACLDCDERFHGRRRRPQLT